jgi:hypothetical protein
MRRLHPRGAANRGICVDAEGAMFGPDVVLVRRTPQGYRSLGRGEASALQKSLHGFDRDEDWLFDQCGRIAASLDRGELALAQIYGLRIPTDDLEDRRDRFAKAGFDPSQPPSPKAIPMAVSGSMPVAARAARVRPHPPRPMTAAQQRNRRRSSLRRNPVPSTPKRPRPPTPTAIKSRPSNGISKYPIRSPTRRRRAIRSCGA